MERKFNELLKMADQGNADAMFQLSECYLSGDGVNKDDNKSEEWLRKAAELGNAKARSELNSRSNKNEGAANYKDKAFEWFNKATEKVNATVKSAADKAAEQVNKAAAEAKAKVETQIKAQAEAKPQAPAVKEAAGTKPQTDPMLGTYKSRKYRTTIIIDSPTHAIDIFVGHKGTEVKREFSVTLNGDKLLLNETANNYDSLSKAQWDECFLPLSETFKGSFNGKKTVLKGYFHHSDGHTSSHFVFDKVK